MSDTPEVGDPFSWIPAAFTVHTDATSDLLGAAVRLSGRIIYVNAAHRWFRAEARFPGGVLRECFKF